MFLIAGRAKYSAADCQLAIGDLSRDNKRNDLGKQHEGSSQIGNRQSAIANPYTPSVFARYNIREDGVQQAAFQRQGRHLAAQRGTTATPAPWPATASG